jgi:hypothetical protein
MTRPLTSKDALRAHPRKAVAYLSAEFLIIQDAWQVEITDKWLKGGWPWEMVQPEMSRRVGFGGSHPHGEPPRWKPARALVSL